MTDTNHVETGIATAASAGSISLMLANVHTYLQIAVAVATLAWWVRLWIKNPNQPPPSLDSK